MKYASLCSGIGAPEQAWKDLGWECRFHAEIEAFPAAVYAHHFTSPNLGDITQFKKWKDYGKLDLIVGGTPCQSFSIAGLRAGLADPRGNLALTFLAVVERYAPRWVVWENVPGVHSSWSDAESRGATTASREIGEANRRAAIEAGFDAQTAGHFADVVEVDQTSDFDQFLAALEQLGYGIATGVLDAQYFGVPQRRERVFVVGHIGGQWQRAAAVLLERTCLLGNPPPSREAGQRTASTVGASPPSRRNSGSNPTAGHLVAKSLKASDGGIDREDGHTIIHVMAHGQTNAEIVSDGSPSLTCNHEAPICIQSATMAGARGQNGVGDSNAGEPMYSLTSRDQHAVAFDTTQITSKGNYSNPKPGEPCHPLASQAHPPAIAFSSKDHGNDAQTDLSPTLRSMSHKDSHLNGGGQVAIAFQPRYFTRDNKTGGADSCGEQTAALSADHGGGDSAPHVAYSMTERTCEGGRQVETMAELSHALTNPGKGGRSQERNIAGNFGVRRLTPKECERLQGFPDSFTAIKYKGKTAADSLRYRALGNSMAVPVLFWIGQRIKLVDTLPPKP